MLWEAQNLQRCRAREERLSLGARLKSPHFQFQLGLPILRVTPPFAVLIRTG